MRRQVLVELFAWMCFPLALVPVTFATFSVVPPAKISWWLQTDAATGVTSPQSREHTSTLKFQSQSQDYYACLKMTTPEVQIIYPDNAEAHFEDIQHRLASWHNFVFQKTGRKYQRYLGWDGPWLESVWTMLVQKIWSDRISGARLSDLFGPYIPLTLPLSDIAAVSESDYKAMIRDLEALLQPQVPYVIVVQHATGLVANHESLKNVMTNHPNVLVFSGGGYGHIPVPLPLRPLSLALEKRPVKERDLFTSYVGTIGHAPHGLRQKMVKSLASFAAASGLHVFAGPSHDWRSIMINSKVSLAPRGFGRTAFHVLEALQMGLVPVHIYEDIPWVPYAELFQSVAFSVNISEIESFWKKLLITDDIQLDRMEARAVALRESHFMVDGIMDQILRFLTNNGSSDLRCQPLPGTPRGV